MATYGTRDATQFPLPSVESNEVYYTLVDEDTGKITLKRVSPLSFTESLDATVGTIEVSGPNAGKFVPGPGATPTETQAFAQQPQAVQTVKNKAIETVTKEKVKEGKDPQTAQTEANQLLSPNTATTPGGNTPLVTEAVDLNIEGSGEGRDKAGSFGDHRYPEGLQNNNQDRIIFTMVKYRPQQFSSFGGGSYGSLGGFEETRKGEEVILGTVTLPVTPGISESNGVEWGSDSMTAGQAIIANTALSGIKGGLGAAANTIGGVVSAVQENVPDVQNAIANAFTEQIAGVSNILSRTQGAVFNPNMALLFRGPTLRPFSFSFKLSPRSESEAKQVIKIIRFFKQGMSPLKSKSNLFLKAPHTFKIKYQYKLEDHPYIGQIKECALQNFAVNYTPEGQYGTFTDGVMFSYEIQMTFQELEPVFNEDYGNAGDDLPVNLLFKKP